MRKPLRWENLLNSLKSRKDVETQRHKDLAIAFAIAMADCSLLSNKKRGL